ncbi:bifunctional 60S ribosomal protein L10P [Babesia duncani]|uniref:Ribosome assembly factor mrt4 n=1 Tax=Babesia duncani TaxID=323732 RepID=A0AAD9PNH3_9APIC|nr:bifunctional 60S ribosomal protein L10P [Babesia duncani]
MPKSARNKEVKLTAVKKNQKQVKSRLIENIRKAIEGPGLGNEPFVYVLSLSNQRNTPLKELRNILLPGRVFYGKNKVMQLALGTRPESEFRTNLSKISQQLVGQTALVVSIDDLDTIRRKVSNFVAKDYAKGGNVATETIKLEKGSKTFEDMPGTLEPMFRQLGLATVLKLGKIELLTDYLLCEAGKPLTPNQAHVLKLLKIQMATFSVGIAAYWSRGSYRNLTNENAKSTEAVAPVVVVPPAATPAAPLAATVSVAPPPSPAC